MNRSKRSILMNAFHPATEVDDPDFFAGRAREVAALTDSLHVAGSCPIIFGPQGSERQASRSKSDILLRAMTNC